MPPDPRSHVRRGLLSGGQNHRAAQRVQLTQWTYFASLRGCVFLIVVSLSPMAPLLRMYWPAADRLDVTHHNETDRLPALDQTQHTRPLSRHRLHGLLRMTGSRMAAQSATGRYHALFFCPQRVSARVVSPLSWVLLVMLALLDLVWLSISPLRVDRSNLVIIGGVAIGFLVWFCIFRLVLYRLRDDMSKVGQCHERVCARSGPLRAGICLYRLLWMGRGYVPMSRSEHSTILARC